MLYEGQKREYMDEALELTGADKAYFVVSWYWGSFDGIVEGAKKTANSWEVISDDSGMERLWVFVYESDQT